MLFRSAVGAWNLVTGRKIRLGASVTAPNWPIHEGLPVRLFGLVYLAGGIYFIVHVGLQGIRWDVVIATYVFLLLSVAWFVQRVRKTRSGRGGVTAPR